MSRLKNMEGTGRARARVKVNSAFDHYNVAEVMGSTVRVATE
ncbi:hypothetical protein YSA_06887 [Pseudomonas putida ND6]|uniref:Uncharacterized protein n=1 Tax=Pseudomonas putida ND6 TaxID=231023 RepID=I3UYA9_PSEPU|nr:hypothetical protein YSA_06887 [Pseudomonas putida ND6]